MEQVRAKRSGKRKSGKERETVVDSSFVFGTGQRIRRVTVGFQVRKGSPTYYAEMVSYTTMSVDLRTHWRGEIKSGQGGQFTTPIQRTAKTWVMGFNQIGPGGERQRVIVRLYGPRGLPTSVSVGNGAVPDVKVKLSYNAGVKEKRDDALGSKGSLFGAGARGRSRRG